METRKWRTEKYNRRKWRTLCRYYTNQQMVKIIWHKTASPPQTDGSIVLARWRQCAFPCGHIGATWPIRLNLCFLRLTRVHNLNGKSIGSAVLAQLTAESPYTYSSCTKIAPSDGVSGPRCNTKFPGPTRVLNPKRISIGSVVLHGPLVWQTDRQTTLFGR